MSSRIQNDKMAFQPLKTFNALAAVAALVAGCANGRQNGFAADRAESLPPQVTAVATGPVARLLTNHSAYQADFSLTLANDADPALLLSGRLFVSGGKIRLEAALKNPGGRALKENDFGLIWDAAANQGYVFSEALQGYAPIESVVRFTNLLTQTLGPPAEHIDGHPVDQANVTVFCSNGEIASFHRLTAHDLDDLPLRVKSLNRPQPFVLALTKLQRGAVAEELFLPPVDFTKYENEAAMLTELGLRQQGVFRVKSDPGGININYNPAVGGQN